MKPVFRTSLPSLAAGVFLLAHPAQAADTKVAFALHGVGAQTCEAVEKQLQATPATARPLLTTWILGYLSALNRLQAETYDASPVQVAEALTEMTLGLCKGNAGALLETVVSTLFKRLDGARAKQASPLVVTKVGNLTTQVRRDTLVAMQAVLIDAKFLTAAAPGDLDEPTQAALREFQKVQNLRETGLPDPATIVRMLVELPAGYQNPNAGGAPAKPAPAPAQPNRRR